MTRKKIPKKKKNKTKNNFTHAMHIRKRKSPQFMMGKMVISVAEIYYFFYVFGILFLQIFSFMVKDADNEI